MHPLHFSSFGTRDESGLYRGGEQLCDAPVDVFSLFLLLRIKPVTSPRRPRKVIVEPKDSKRKSETQTVCVETILYVSLRRIK